jgi:Glycosyltransferase 61
VRPYTRKPDKTMLLIREVSVKIISKRKAPPCRVNHSVPAVVFSNKGYCGNYWHDFNDILVPLFITARQFRGEVQFLVTQMKSWWFGKYSNYFQGMSKYDIIDLDNMDDVHCFPRTIVGLHSHKDFSIDPTRAPNGYSMQDFTKFMRGVYSLERDAPIKIGEIPGRKPKLYIIPRRNKRMLTNMNEIVPMAEELGFEVVIEGSVEYASIKDAAQLINSCDVMMGVHGAGLTNMVFLPINAVVIQIIPLGKIDRLFHNEFGIPAIDMKLKYIAYNITEEESTLLNLYQRDDPILTDPMSIHKQGWDTVSRIYLQEQNVKLDVNRFRPILRKAIKYLSAEHNS